MSCSLNSLNSLNGGYIGDYYRGNKGDTRSLDYGSYRGHPANLDHKDLHWGHMMVLWGSYWGLGRE